MSLFLGKKKYIKVKLRIRLRNIIILKELPGEKERKIYFTLGLFTLVVVVAGGVGVVLPPVTPEPVAVSRLTDSTSAVPAVAMEVADEIDPVEGGGGGNNLPTSSVNCCSVISLLAKRFIKLTNSNRLSWGTILIKSYGILGEKESGAEVESVIGDVAGILSIADVAAVVFAVMAVVVAVVVVVVAAAVVKPVVKDEVIVD